MEYIVEKDLKNENANYGVYDSINSETILKNLGAISENKYIFDSNIGDHHCQSDKYLDELGLFNIMSCITDRNDYILINIYYVDRRENTVPITLFQYDTIIGILQECRKYYYSVKPLKIEISEKIFTNCDKSKIIIYPRDENSEKLFHDDEKPYYDLESIGSVILALENEKNRILTSKEENKQNNNHKIYKLLPFLKKA